MYFYVLINLKHSFTQVFSQSQAQRTLIQPHTRLARGHSVKGRPATQMSKRLRQAVPHKVAVNVAATVPWHSPDTFSSLGWVLLEGVDSTLVSFSSLQQHTGENELYKERTGSVSSQFWGFKPKIRWPPWFGLLMTAAKVECGAWVEVSQEAESSCPSQSSCSSPLLLPGTRTRPQGPKDRPLGSPSELCNWVKFLPSWWD